MGYHTTERQSRTAQCDLETHLGSPGVVSGVPAHLLVARDDTWPQHQVEDYGQATGVLGARPRRISRMALANATPSCTCQADD